jgi:hypothetical protein
MDSIGMLLLALIAGVGIGSAITILIQKRRDAGTVGTNPELHAYITSAEAKLQAQVDELKTKLLPADTQEKLKGIGDGLLSTIKDKLLDDLSGLRLNGESHLQQIEDIVKRIEGLTEAELVKLHLEKETPPADPVLAVSPSDPQTVVSSEPAIPADQNKVV